MPIQMDLFLPINYRRIVSTVVMAPPCDGSMNVYNHACMNEMRPETVVDLQRRQQALVVNRAVHYMMEHGLYPARWRCPGYGTWAAYSQAVLSKP